MKFHHVLLTLFVVCANLVAHAEISFNRGVALLSQEAQKLAFNHRPMTIDLGLAALKRNAEFAPLFSHYTLVKDSLSLQSSTPLEPRVVMFGHTAKLVVTFNSKTATSGHDSLETAEFDSVQNQVLFREILFKDEFSKKLKILIGNSKSLKQLKSDDLKNELLLTTDDIEYEDKHLAVTRPNPEKCMQCHALSAENYPGVARYIWQDYKMWPRVYGELDDNVEATKNESGQLATFKVFAINADRYKHLDGLKIPNFPYSIGPLKTGTLDTRPNLLLTNLLFTRFSKVVAQTFFNRMSQASRREFKITFEDNSNSAIAVFTPLANALSFSLDQATEVLGVDQTDETEGGNLGGDNGIGYSNLLGGGNTISDLVAQELYRLIGTTDRNVQKRIDLLIEENRERAKLPPETGYHLLRNLNDATREWMIRHIYISN